MNSTTIAAAIFLPVAPVAMALCYWRGQRRARRQAAEHFAEQVEVWLVVRGRHG